MKYTILTFCKYVLFGAALIPTLVIAYVMIPLLPWPWRVGIFLPFIVLLLWGALESLNKLLRKKGEQAAPAQQEAVPVEPQLAESAERDRIQELQQSWRVAVGMLRASHLKQEGEPLHVLPWYLILGSTGSGKSSAVRGARLLSPFAAGQCEAGATVNCDWHFYDQGIVMDTAGRLAVPLQPRSDQEEWRVFLSLLKKYRGLEAINGVIVTVAADELGSGDSAALEDQGRELRCRLDEMIRRLGVNFPVYLLITKCDLIGGMSEFCDELPPESLDQPMGVLNEASDGDVARVVERFASYLDQRMRMLRLLLLHRGCHAPTGRLLLFPDRLRELRPGLDLFTRAVFAQNHYQETPLLRGIYLCSAGARAAVPDARHGLFLHDFFEKVLPRDRELWSPSTQATRRRRLTRTAMAACWLFFCATLCVLLTCSFMKNVAVMRKAVALALSPPQLQGKVAADLAALDKMGQSVSELEQENLSWWMPRFGLTRSIEVERELKGRYCATYSEHLLGPYDDSLSEALTAIAPTIPDSAFGGLVLHLSRRCNLIKARQAGAGFAELSGRPLPDYGVLASQAPEWSDPRPGRLYLRYVAWRADGAGLARELQRLQLLLKRLVLLRGADLGWVVGYVDREEGGAAISLQEFWGGSRPFPGEPTLAAACTRRGRARLTSILQELSAAYPEPGVLEREKKELVRRYRDLSFQAWQRFAYELPQGEKRLLAPGEWRKVAVGMAGEQGPYFRFMGKVISELEPFGAADSLPLWIVELYRFQALKGAGPAGVASSLSGQASRVAGSLGNPGRKGSLPGAESEANLAKDYLNAVAQVAPVAKSRTLAHRMALQAFSESAEAGKSPLYQAAEAAQKLNQLLSKGAGDDTFARLIYGPITFYGTYIRMETACALQAQWEQNVLKEVQGTSDPQTLQYLLGKDGPVWKYVGDWANPFIGWSPARGYFPKAALGGAIPFKPEFYSFLAQGGRARIAAAAGSQKPVYQVTIKGLPTDANAEARVKPQGTRLELHCSTGAQVIVNMNYPVSRPFVYTPDMCSDVLLQIEVGDTVVTRHYAGSSGFSDFLRDFPAGRHTFYPRNFPQEKEALERMGIRFIKVNYQMFGADDLAGKQAPPLPARIPMKIAECWD